MHSIQELIIEYQADLKENRVSYSDEELTRLKSELKTAYQVLKEENPTVHEDAEFMHAYKSAHGLIQHELKERKLDGNLTIDDILNGQGEQTFRDNVFKRAERQIRRGDYSHTPSEYSSLSDAVQDSTSSHSSVAVQHLRQKYISGKNNKSISEFDAFITNTYQAKYQTLMEQYSHVEQEYRAFIPHLPVAEQITALETLVSEADDFNSTYHAQTIVGNWIRQEAPNRLLKEDISGQNRERIKNLGYALVQNKPNTGTADLYHLPVVRRGEHERGSIFDGAGYAVASIAGLLLMVSPIIERFMN